MAQPTDIAAILSRLSQKSLMVGIPQKNDTRSGSPIGNAMIGYIHEFGSQHQGIPARAHLVPGVNAAMPDIVKYMEQAAKAAMKGDEALSDILIGRAGQVAVNSVKRIIKAKIDPPLKPATIARRRIRTKGSKYRRKASAPADATPLYDTRAYINSIAYEVSGPKTPKKLPTSSGP